jgi:DNA-binding FadR family transcriptional regulator
MGDVLVRLRFVLRNALNRLASEGLVELQPNRGARVREISIEEAIELSPVPGRPSVSAYADVPTGLYR